MEALWTLRPVADEAAVDHVAEVLNDLPRPLARTLVLRGITTLDAARAFFRPSLAAQHDPFAMCGMDRAAARLARAIREKETVVVYGDYDVDGTTATALMTSFLRRMGADVSFFVPNRFEHGYGLSIAGLDVAASRGATLVVALDCGITAHEAAAYAREIGLDLVIADHHKPEDRIPDAYAVLDPKKDTCAYPFKELTGCGLGFKLAQAVLAQLGRSTDEANDLLDLVAASTAADIVPLDGENRVLMAHGLERLRSNPRPGLAALARVTGLDLATASTESLVFALGPRINAAGRLGSADVAVELLLADDPELADAHAAALEVPNVERRALDQHVQEEATHLAEAQIAAGAENSVVLYKRDWHLGVIGIVASRLVERFHRPAVMLGAAPGGLVKGSARSVGGISIHAALALCEAHLEAFGGHDFAAGLTLREENVPAFQQAFDRAVGEVAAAGALVRSFDVDADLDLDWFTGRFWAVLRQFAPHGPENLTPLFRATNLDIVGGPQQVGRDRQHLKCYVRQRGGTCVFEVIGYRLGDRVTALSSAMRRGQPIELLGNVEENCFRGQRSLQLKVKDIRPMAEAPTDA